MGEKYETLLRAAEPDAEATARWVTAVVSPGLELADSDAIVLLREVVVLEKAEPFVLYQHCRPSSDRGLTYN